MIRKFTSLKKKIAGTWNKVLHVDFHFESISKWIIFFINELCSLFSQKKNIYMADNRRLGLSSSMNEAKY